MRLPPPRPSSETSEELGFERQEMVRWLDPHQLADAALRVVLSAIFGIYADKREQLAIHADERFSYDDAGELWIDYVSDTADGFDPTYAVALTLARERLVVDGQETERGQVLIMGGDQVYPTADRKCYQNHLQGPYKAALPWVEPDEVPHLYAIPGNHDWYDGLTNFLRVFCQQGWMGAWRTRQHRSYFAINLPGRWWLWGIDIQFDTYIDKPQLDYFRAASRELQRGDGVILVTGKPSWVKIERGRAVPDSYRNLAYFQEEVIERPGARVAVTLSGDHHHYSRYADAAGDQKITWGGGGAYLYPTHHLPLTLELPDRRGQGTTTFDRRAIYPTVDVSKRLRWGALRLVIKTPRMPRVLAGGYGLLGLVLAGAAKDATSSAVSGARAHGFLGLLADQVSPGSVALSLGFVGLLVAFAKARSPVVRVAAGVIHGAIHLALVWLTTLLTLELIVSLLPRAGGLATTVLVVIATAAVGRTLGALLFGIYVIVADELLGAGGGRNANNAFACQSIPDYKGFLRMHLGRDGALTIYPIGIDHVPRKWRLDTDAPAAAPWFSPVDREIEARLIEPPVRVD